MCDTILIHRILVIMKYVMVQSTTEKWLEFTYHEVKIATCDV